MSMTNRDLSIQSSGEVILRIKNEKDSKIDISVKIDLDTFALKETVFFARTEDDYDLGCYS